MKVKITHWWPGREFKGPSPIPATFIKRAESMGSRYLTVATLEIDYKPVAAGLAFCCPKDCPDKHLGRQIALGRMRQNAIRNGVIEA